MRLTHFPPAYRSSFAFVIFASAVLQNGALAQPNPIVVGEARFSVVSPICIRLEYSTNHKFVEKPSLFAAERKSLFSGFKLEHHGNTTTIDTGVINLTYHPDGRSFSASNLSAEIHAGSVAAHWTPGAPNPGNLGGTLTTLDGADGPEDLGEGLLSRDGWYLLDDSRSPLITLNWVESRPKDAGTDWYLFGYGHDYKSALKSLAAISGSVPLPRKYALGAWYSRYWPYSSADYRQIVAEYEQHDFPLDNIVLDMDWHKDGWTGWSWNRKLLPDAEQLLPWFHRQGLHDTVNLHPADGVGPQEDQYSAFMRDMGADPSSRKTLDFDAGSKKYMDALFKDVLTPLRHDGIDFWWLDWQQDPYTLSVPDLTNLFWLNTLLFDDSCKDGQRGMSFSRWGGWGDQRHPIHFSGDASTSFQMLAFEVPFTSTAGNVGCFFWSHDIGGHNRGRNEESYARWVQFGAMSAVLRSHSTRDVTMDRRPWLYPNWATDSMRVSFHLRDKLFPYIYSSAKQTAEKTVPLLRPLYLEYPELEQAYHQAQEYLFGDDILVAPIVSPGVGPARVSHQTVWFPPSAGGRGPAWYDYFTGERYEAGANVLVGGTIDEFPLYFKGGTPIPMRLYNQRMGTAPLETLVVRAYPGADGPKSNFTLYEDDGQTTGYKHGQSSQTQLTYRRNANVVTVTVGAAAGSYSGQISKRGLVIELPVTSRATGAEVNGKRVAFAYNPATETNSIAIPARPIGQATTVVVHCSEGENGVLKAAAFKRRSVGVLGTFNFPGSGHVKSILGAALNQAKTNDQRDELLAAAGVGRVAHNTAPYLYQGELKDEFFTRPGLLDSPAVITKGGVVNLAVNGSVLDLRNGIDSFQFRGKSFWTASDAEFTVAGHKIRQSTVTPGFDPQIVNPANLAATATVTASGSQPGYLPEGAVDGVVGGYPSETNNEWSSGTKTGAWIQLDWKTSQSVSQIILYDRPNLVDQVTAGTLTFSDGSKVSVGSLPNDAQRGLTVTFPSKNVRWVRFTVDAVKPGTENSGLSQIAVFG